MTIRLSSQAYKATLRDLGHVWAGDLPAFNYRVKRSSRVALVISTIGGQMEIQSASTAVEAR